MSTRAKKLTITFSIIGALVLLMIVFGVLFSLRTINVDYITTGSHIENYTRDEVIRQSGIKKGKSIIFTNYKAAQSRLEKALPFGKFKVVRTFPNKVTIYVSEREKVFRVVDQEGNWHIYDESLKCLDVVPEANLTIDQNDEVPILNGAEFEQVNEGEFVNNQALANKITKIIDGVYGAGETPINIMSDITLGYDEVNQFSTCTLTVRGTGVKIVIQGEENFSVKLAFAVFIYNDVSQDSNGQHAGHLNEVTITALNNFDVKHKSVRVVCTIDGSVDVTQLEIGEF